MVAHGGSTVFRIKFKERKTPFLFCSSNVAAEKTIYTLVCNKLNGSACQETVNCSHKLFQPRFSGTVQLIINFIFCLFVD